MDQPTLEEKHFSHNLPTRIQPFVDREQELQQVSQALLDPDIPIVTIVGIGGIGKTALALEVAYRLLEQSQFAGGICWLDCRGSDNTLDVILRTIQTSFGLAPTPTLHEGVRRYLRTHLCLLVLDGYEVVTQDMELLAFLERLPKPSKALLTSRKDIRLRRGWRLELAGLTTEGAVRLFEETADRYGLKVQQEQIPLVAEICQPLEGNPLAILSLVATQAGSVSVPLDILKQPIAEGLRALNLEVAFRASYEKLSEKARVLLQRLSIFAADVDDEAIENVCQVKGWQEAWSELVRFAFVREQDNRYSLLPVVRSLALKLSEETGEQEKYEERAAAYFLELTEVAEGKLNTTEASNGIAIAKNERANMLAGQEWYWAHERWKEVMAYGYALDRLLDAAGFWEDRVTVLRRAVEASKRKGDAGEQARLLHNLAVVYQEQGDYAAARRFYQEGLNSFRELGDRHGEAIALSNLGVIYENQGQWAEAVTLYERSLTIQRELGDRAGEARTQINLGNIYQSQGRLAEATALYEEGLAILREVGDRHGEANALSNLGNIYQSQGRLGEATALYEESLAILRERGDRHGEANTLSNLGNVYQGQSRLAQATALYEESLAILRQLGDRQGEANTLNNLGIVYQDQGRYTEARSLYQESLAIKQLLGDQQGIASTLHQLATLAQRSGAYEEARRYYEQAIAISERLGDISSLAIAFGNLGTTFEDEGDFRQALGYLEKSAELFQRVGDASNLAIAYRAIARIRQKLGDLEASIAALSQALTLSLRVAPRPVLETARHVVDYGKHLIAQDKYADALTLITELSAVLDNIEQEANTVYETPISPDEAKTYHTLKEPAPTYHTLYVYDSPALEAAALMKSMLSVIASVASVRMEGSPPAQYERALQALELARQVDKATAGALELAQWVREASGYEFVELEEADRWPPHLAYLVHVAARYERDEDWSAAVDAYRQARALLDPNKGEEELKRFTEIGFRLGLCLKQDGHWSEALKQQEENVAGYKKLGNPYGKANSYLEMGHIYQMMNIYDLALLYYGEAYYLYQQAAEEARDEAARRLAQRGMADARESLGDLEFQLKMLPQAAIHLEEAERLYADLGMPGKAAIVRQMLEEARARAGG
jgi:tetratricopeptide (TPR) repeat protein